MTISPLPNSKIPLIDDGKSVTLPWWRWFNSLTGSGSQGTQGPPGPRGARGPAGAAGTDTSTPLSFLSLALLDATSQPLPNPSPTTLGGVESFAPVAHSWINTISTSGAPGATQPASTDLSDAVATTTFTPTVTFATPGDLAVVYTVQTGKYAKVGNLVTFYVTLAFTPTYTTAAGNLNLSALPVAPANAGVTAVTVRSLGAMVWPAGSTQVVATLEPTLIAFTGFGSGVAPAAFTTTQVPTAVAQVIRISGSYLA